MPELSSLILPGGSRAGAHVHLARTVRRRAERRARALRLVLPGTGRPGGHPTATAGRAGPAGWNSSAAGPAR
ncbi:hypothetical protein [Micromonospora sp. NPDC005707]|uniref:hypothetical protein n=1 Tax=Micromonospora sp. NPDC005707 TaxID=3157050 RepID=UPI0033F30317